MPTRSLLILCLSVSLTLAGCLTYKSLTYRLTIREDHSGTLEAEGLGISSTESLPSNAQAELAKFYAGGFASAVDDFAKRFGLRDVTSSLSNVSAERCDGKAGGSFSNLVRVVSGFADNTPLHVERTKTEIFVAFEMARSSGSTEDRFIVRSAAPLLEHNAQKLESVQIDGKPFTHLEWHLSSAGPTLISFRLKREVR
jgi:hypothetical protein